jgi:hypothetical protein
MLWSALNALLYVALGWFLWRVYVITLGYFEFLYYKKQGVVFLSKFNLFTDVMRIVKGFEKNPNALSWIKIQRDALNLEKENLP